MNVGQIIRRLREKEGLSQIQLADKLNINNSVLSRIESGKRHIEDSELILFADFFDTNIEYLLGRTDDPSPITKNKELSASGDIYVAYLGGPKKVLDAEEAAHLDEALEMFRAFREKRMKEIEKKER
ncbi:XRE family transcriptional regulator [Paenibacillus pinisoli]|uniref:XRE family transcriptional regulator n=1 Tax=Paenibacillus pinisoli TaxID=1276110 RepID=A0A3A6PQR9_9BACL|nr:XRE family transcriptional regulator [Paenibacillus pinisoli]